MGGRLPLKKKLLAKELYFACLPNKEICARSGVKELTLKHWINQEGWVAEKKAHIQKVMEDSAAEFTRFITVERTATAQQHMEMTSVLESKVKNKLEKILGPELNVDGQAEDGNFKLQDAKEIYYLTRALKDLSDIRARATGLSEKLYQPSDDNRRISLMQVNMQARIKDALPTKEEFIEAESSEKE